MMEAELGGEKSGAAIVERQQAGAPVPQVLDEGLDDPRVDAADFEGAVASKVLSQIV